MYMCVEFTASLLTNVTRKLAPSCVCRVTAHFESMNNRSILSSTHQHPVVHARTFCGPLHCIVRLLRIGPFFLHILPIHLHTHVCRGRLPLLSAPRRTPPMHSSLTGLGDGGKAGVDAADLGGPSYLVGSAVHSEHASRDRLLPKRTQGVEPIE